MSGTPSTDRRSFLKTGSLVAGAVIAGVGGWLITRALAAAGALGAFPAGQEARERRAV